MDIVRIGSLGVSAHWAKNMTWPASELAEARFTAVASRDPGKAQEAVAQGWATRAYQGYEALLADPEIDAVYIPLPNHLHEEWIKKAADAGKAILCEKPLALDAKQTEAAFEYCARRGVLLMEAFMYRYHPQWIHAHKLVQYGTLGDVRSLHTVFAYNNPDAGNIRNQLAAGGGALMDIGCYAVSTARYLMGREPRRVLSLISRHPGFGTDVLSSAILDFDGPRALFTVGTLTGQAQRVDVFGSGGSLSIQIPFNTPFDVPAEVEVRTAIGPRTVTFDAVNQYGLELAGFARAVRGLEAPRVTPADSLGNARVIDALFASAREDRWVTV